METLLPELWLAMVLIALRIDRIGKGYRLPEGSPLAKGKELGLAVELSASVSDFEALAGPRDQEPGITNRRLLRKSQWIDLVLIVAYVGLFARLGCKEASRGPLWASILGWTTLVSILLAGLFDVAEDRVIRRLVDGTSRIGARPFGQPKWIFYFLAISSLAPAFLPPACQACWGYIQAALLLPGGLLGLGAALGGNRKGISLGLTLTLAGIAALGVSILWPALCPWPS